MTRYWYGLITGAVAVLAARAAVHQEWIIALEGLGGVIAITLLMIGAQRTSAPGQG
jgi:hypothetical protein